MKTLILTALIVLAPIASFAQDVEQLPAPKAAEIAQDRTITWYMAHESDRKAMIAHCDDDPGHLKDDPDCVNAKKADNQAGVNDFKSGVDNTIQGAANLFQGRGN